MLDFALESDAAKVIIFVENSEKILVRGKDGGEKLLFFCRFLNGITIRLLGDYGFFGLGCCPRDLGKNELVGSSTFAVEFLRVSVE
jgi:hypothetical protein